MSVYNPDKWLLLEITPDDGSDMWIAIFASWSGGYLTGDNWKVNSGIESATQDKDHYYFKGYSGSVYKCHKNSYGVAGAYNRGVLSDFEKQTGVRVMEESEVEEMYSEL